MWQIQPDPTRALSGAFDVVVKPLPPPRYNIAPSQPLGVIVGLAEGKRQFRLMQWGLIPSWAKDPKIGARLINARAETAREKPSFRAAFKRRRCLIPADGFYEWQRLRECQKLWESSKSRSIHELSLYTSIMESDLKRKKLYPVTIVIVEILQVNTQRSIVSTSYKFEDYRQF